MVIMKSFNSLAVMAVAFGTCWCSFVMAVPVASNTQSVASNAIVVESPDSGYVANSNKSYLHDVHVVTVKEWESYIQIESGGRTTEWLKGKIDSLTTDATRLLKQGHASEGIALSVVGSVMSAYYLQLTGPLTSAKSESFSRDFNQNRKALISAGVGENVFRDSFSNLKIALPPQKVVVSKVEEGTSMKVRKADNTERKLLTNAVRQRLFDPDSAKFDEYLVVGSDSACVILNAKNRMGGYSGRSATYLKKIDGVWHSINSMQSLETCLVVVQKLSGQ